MRLDRIIWEKKNKKKTEKQKWFQLFLVERNSFLTQSKNAARKEAWRAEEEMREYFRCSRLQTNDVSASSKSQTIVNNVTMQYISLNRYAPFFIIQFCFRIITAMCRQLHHRCRLLDWKIERKSFGPKSIALILMQLHLMCSLAHSLSRNSVKAIFNSRKEFRGQANNRCCIRAAWDAGDALQLANAKMWIWLTDSTIVFFIINLFLRMHGRRTDARILRIYIYTIIYFLHIPK